MRSVHQDESTREQELVLDLDEVARQGAKKMLAQALQAEVEAYLRAAEGDRDERGRALVVKNGYARSRQIACGAGAIGVRAPRVNDERVDQASGERKRFTSAILPPYMRCSPKISEVLPLLYLHGLSSGTSLRPCGSSSVARPACLPRPSSTSPSNGKRNASRSWSANSRRRTTSTYGWTAYTRRSGSGTTIGYAAW